MSCKHPKFVENLKAILDMGNVLPLKDVLIKKSFKHPKILKIKSDKRWKTNLLSIKAGKQIFWILELFFDLLLICRRSGHVAG